MKTLSASYILKIPVDQPELLFKSKDDCKRDYQVLVSLWHPDKNPMAEDEVIAHINVLYKLACHRIQFDSWVIPGTITIKATNGTKYNLKYHSKKDFELGEIYVGDTIIAYALFKDNEDLLINAKTRIGQFKYANDVMKDEFKKLLPEIIKEVETEDRFFVLIKKTKDQLLLGDVLNHSIIDPKHVAWIISRLYNIACFLNFNGIVNAGIMVDSCLISPEFHTVSLVGGWWYSAIVGSDLIALPATAVEFCSSDIVTKQKADVKIDLEMIKVLGLQLLGDMYGSKLLMNKSIPTPLVTWLRSPSSNAITDFKTWQEKVLVDSFGKRRFTEMKLSATDIYKDKK